MREDGEERGMLVGEVVVGCGSRPEETVFMPSMLGCGGRKVIVVAIEVVLIIDVSRL